MTLEELKELQSLPLPFKVEITKQRIADFYDRLEGKVYVAFSGGKDSSALLHLVRSIYPDTLAVYGNTGIDLPSVRKLVSATDNVKVLPPLKTFGRVLKEEDYDGFDDEEGGGADNSDCTLEGVSDIEVSEYTETWKPFWEV